MARNQSRPRQEKAHTFWHNLAARETPGRWQPDGTILVLQLVTLLLVLVVIPLFERHTAGRVASTTGLTFVFVTGIIVNRRHPAVLLSGSLAALKRGFRHIDKDFATYPAQYRYRLRQPARLTYSFSSRDCFISCRSRVGGGR